MSDIIIHHTATDNTLSSDEMLKSMRNHWIVNKWASIVPTHYIIDAQGNHTKVNDINIIVWATLNARANAEWVHIELVGNFNNHEPTEEQYKKLAQLIERIKEKAPIERVSTHKEHWATSCPWEKFDMNRLYQPQWIDYNPLDYDWTRFNYKMTSYYSPQANQSHYFYSHKLWRRRTLEEEIAMNCWYNENLTLEKNIEVCKYPANWMELLNEHIGKVWACSRDIPLWTKLYIDWYWEITCVDRGSAIWSYRLDIWNWYWQQWIDNIEKWRLWIPNVARVKIVK